MSSFSNGGAALVVAQPGLACAPDVTAGREYELGASYESTAPTAFEAYYETSAGTWDAWASGPTLPVASSWTQAAWTTPPAPAGAMAISFGVVLSSLGSLSTGAYSFGAAVPEISAISPNSGNIAGGTKVTITGNLLAGATAVSFGPVAASAFKVVSDTTITAISPPKVAGVDNVVVTTPEGTSAAVSADQFTYKGS
ncbi:MAG TPA: IPT/TIG domain-containing protein [Acidimicrobiales bacterium]|nr:IPT/TIG domain-containing protein [Acidimicrobiales bacterium]